MDVDEKTAPLFFFLETRERKKVKDISSEKSFYS